MQTFDDNISEKLAQRKRRPKKDRFVIERHMISTKMPLSMFRNITDESRFDFKLKQMKTLNRNDRLGSLKGHENRSSLKGSTGR